MGNQILSTPLHSILLSLLLNWQYIGVLIRYIYQWPHWIKNKHLKRGEAKFPDAISGRSHSQKSRILVMRETEVAISK